MADMAASSTGPSNRPHPWTHANSVPDRFTPRRRSGAPSWSTNRFPDTWTARTGVDAARAGWAGTTVATAMARATATDAMTTDIRTTGRLTTDLVGSQRPPIEQFGRIRRAGGARETGAESRDPRAEGSGRLVLRPGLGLAGGAGDLDLRLP